MYLVTKVVTCAGCNFSTVQDFLDWHEGLGFNGGLFRSWLAEKQSEGKLVYFTTNVLAPDKVENIYLFQDEAAYNEFEAFLAAAPMAGDVADSLANGMSVDSVTTQNV